MESRVLNSEEYGSFESTRYFYTLQGVNEIISLITNLCHGYEETANTTRSRLTNPEYMGMITDLYLDEDEDDKN